MPSRYSTLIPLAASALLALAGTLFPAAARSIEIGEVLEHSQATQEQALSAVMVPRDDPRSLRLHDTFATLLTASGLPDDTPLIVFEGQVLAVCLHGGVIAVNASVGDLPESERRFIVAHELGHLRARHWDDFKRLYAHFIPGEVTKEKTDAVAADLGRAASAQAYTQEFEADAFALNMLRRLGDGTDGSVAVLHRLPMVHDTATHPGTEARVEHLTRLASE